MHVMMPIHCSQESLQQRYVNVETSLQNEVKTLQGNVEEKDRHIGNVGLHTRYLFMIALSLI